jgi:NADH-quinone oxidoreductase subunit M
MYQRVMLGPVTKPKNMQISDMSRRELAVILPLIALIFLMGVYPRPFLHTMEASVRLTLERSTAAAAKTRGLER